MKRLVAVAALAASAIIFAIGSSAGASDPHGPHDGSTAHPHHKHMANGECKDMGGPNFEADSRGRHWGAVKGEQIHHGTCAQHGG